MITALRHWKAREWRFMALIALNLLCMGLYLGAGEKGGPNGSGGWRRIDTAAVQRHIDSGDLAGHEAQWYHPARPGELRTGAAER
jgi:hypothetical protein